jgi:hypothetical protein
MERLRNPFPQARHIGWAPRFPRKKPLDLGIAYATVGVSMRHNYCAECKGISEVRAQRLISEALSCVLN